MKLALGLIETPHAQAHNVRQRLHAEPTMTTAYDFETHTLDGKPVRLQQYAGKALLIVNTASKCGFTPQYTGLEELHRKYGERGLVVLGFPCNQFGEQEPGTPSEIGAFCEQNYSVTFPVFEKIDVNGEAAHPLFEWLKASAPGILGSKSIKWNFTKFLVDRQGQVKSRYAPTTKPEDLASDIEAVL
jgi:glutathione peroxidase